MNSNAKPVIDFIIRLKDIIYSALLISSNILLSLVLLSFKSLSLEFTSENIYKIKEVDFVNKLILIFWKVLLHIEYKKKLKFTLGFKEYSK